MSPLISVKGSPLFQKVYVRGHVSDFSADMINEYLVFKLLDSDDAEFWINPLPSDDDFNMDIVATELTGHPMIWKAETRRLCSQLTSKYTMLTRVGLFNWFSSLHQSTIDHNI